MTVVFHDINTCTSTSSQTHTHIHTHKHGYPSNRLRSHHGITCIKTSQHVGQSASGCRCLIRNTWHFIQTSAVARQYHLVWLLPACACSQTGQWMNLHHWTWLGLPRILRDCQNPRHLLTYWNSPVNLGSSSSLDPHCKQQHILTLHNSYICWHCRTTRLTEFITLSLHKKKLQIIVFNRPKLSALMNYRTIHFKTAKKDAEKLYEMSRKLQANKENGQMLSVLRMAQVKTKQVKNR